MKTPNLARLLASLLAVALVGAAFAWVFSNETPKGRVRGRVLLADSGRPLGDVDVLLTPFKNYGRPVASVRGRTDAEGRFLLLGVPAGPYVLSGSSRAHKVEGVGLQVDEGRTTDTDMLLKRSEPDLRVAQHVRVFAATLPANAGVRDKPFLPVQGYVDGNKAPGTDALRVRVFQTRLSRLLPDDNAFDALQQIGRTYEDDAKKKTLPAALLHPKAAGTSAPRLVFARDVPITEADREGFYHKRIPLPAGRPGVFLVDVTHGSAGKQKQSVCSWVVASDMALVVKRAPASGERGPQLVAFATDLLTGKPERGAAVRAYRAGRVVATATTGDGGLATLDLPRKVRSSDEEPRLMTVALRGDDEAVLGQSEYDYEEEGAFAVAAYTDRPLYRPGQKIFYKGIARRKRETPGRYDVPDGLPVTVEIRDPGGERISRSVTRTNRFGSFSGAAELSPEAPTGMFTLVANVSGERHTTDIEVAAYRKPEFAVTVKADKPRYVRGDEATVNVEGKFYFGTPVAGAKIKYSVYRETDWSAEYPDDYADDEDEAGPLHGWGGGDVYEGYYGESVAEGEATLNENGRAVLHFPTRPAPQKSNDENTDEEREGQAVKTSDADEADAPQAEVFTVSVTATDDAKREVSGEGSLRVTSGDLHLSVAPEGYVAEPGRPSGVIVTARDFDNKPVANLPVSLAVHLGRWNEKTKQYENELEGTPQTLTTGLDGRAVFPITPAHAGELSLLATAKDKANRPLRARAYLWAAGDRGGELQTEYADLSLLTDKRRYRPGETARVLVNTARTGQTVLVTVEGERVYKTLLVPITQRSTVLRLPILPSYGPNVSLAACYVRDKHFASSEVPLRVTLPERDIRVSVRADRARYQPGDTITYAIQTTDPNGRPAPAELSFGVVDESIYALREDDPRLLKTTFYPRRTNRVSTTYSFESLYLGDADKTEPNIPARKRFPDTAYWNPALQTDAAGRARITFALPDTLTTWRATVLAQTLSTAIGRETNKILVTKPFFVRLETPRFLTQNDQSRLLALVHNETGARQNVRVRLVSDANLTLTGDTTQTLDLAPGEIGQAAWPVTATGVQHARLRVTAWTGNTNNGRPFTDGVETALAVRLHGRDTFTSEAGVLTPHAPQPEDDRIGNSRAALGTTTAVTTTLALDRNAIPQASRLTVRLTPSVGSALAPALETLADFPYGCVEQTMSRFLPDILIARLQHQTGRTLLPPDRAAKLPQMVRDGLSRLYRFQRPDGAWGWWENEAEADPFMTAYVLYGLSIAQSEGYEVSPDVLKRAHDAAVKMIPSGRIGTRRKAFLLYALALSGDTAIVRATLPRLVAKTGAMPTDGLAFLVLAGHASGDTSNDDNLLAQIDARARIYSGLRHWQTKEEPWENSDRLFTALALRATLAARPNDTARTTPILRWLMASRTDTFWGNTRDTSFVLTALCDYLTLHPDDAAPTGTVRVKVNDRLIKEIALTPEIVRERETVVRVPASALQRSANKITVERAGGGATSTLFWSAALRQIIAGEDLQAVSPSGLSVTREYRRVLPKKSGGDSWTLQTEPTEGRLNQGDQVRVRLTLTVPRDMTYVLIEDAYPSGCEVTERGEADESTGWDYWYSSVDVRDDRIAFFARTLKAGTHTIEYNLRAQTPGAYHALPTLLQAMYAPDIRSETAEARVEVRP